MTCTPVQLDEVKHMHIQHPVFKRASGRLLAAGFGIALLGMAVMMLALMIGLSQTLTPERFVITFGGELLGLGVMIFGVRVSEQSVE